MGAFKPSARQLDAAAQLFICMALSDIAKQAFTKMSAEILAAGQYRSSYHGDPRWPNEPQYVTDPKLDYHIQGIREGSPPESDAGRYFSEVDRHAKDMGWRQGVNADCILSNNVMRAENELIAAFEPVTKLNLEDLRFLDDRKKLIELTLRFMAPFVKGLDMEARKRRYFSEHVYEKIPS